MPSFSEFDDPKIPGNVLRIRQLLTENNHIQYAMPNSNCLRSGPKRADFLALYSTEIAELRQLAFEAFQLCCDIKSGDATSKLSMVGHSSLNPIMDYVIKQPWFTSDLNKVGPIPD